MNSHHTQTTQFSWSALSKALPPSAARINTFFHVLDAFFEFQEGCMSARIWGVYPLITSDKQYEDIFCLTMCFFNLCYLVPIHFTCLEITATPFSCETSAVFAGLKNLTQLSFNIRVIG